MFFPKTRFTLSDKECTQVKFLDMFYGLPPKALLNHLLLMNDACNGTVVTSLSVTRIINVKKKLKRHY